MGCSSWISAVVEFDRCTRVDLLSSIMALGWEPNESSFVVPPNGGPGDWVGIDRTDRGVLLQSIGESGGYCGIAGLHNAVSDSWITVTFDQKTRELTIHLNAGCPMHQSVPRAVDPSWALGLLRQIQEAGNGQWWLHNVIFSTDTPW